MIGDGTAGHLLKVSFLLLVLAVVFYGTLFYLAESPKTITSRFEGFYWALTTLTTTGYGDICPKTFWGRVLALITMLSGLLVFALLVAAFYQWYVERTEGVARQLWLEIAARKETKYFLTDNLQELKSLACFLGFESYQLSQEYLSKDVKIQTRQDKRTINIKRKVGLSTYVCEIEFDQVAGEIFHEALHEAIQEIVTTTKTRFEKETNPGTIVKVDFYDNYALMEITCSPEENATSLIPHEFQQYVIGEVAVKDRETPQHDRASLLKIAKTINY